MFKKHHFILSLSFFALMNFAIVNNSSAQNTQLDKNRPNIIFILVDDLGWKDLGIYGSTFYETPNIDQLAAEGMKFTDAYASSTVCSPSRSSIMTGQYPVHTGITDWIPGGQNTRGPEPFQKLIPAELAFNLPKSEMTIAQALKNHGYVTFHAGKWHLGLVPSSWPTAMGYDYNYGGWAAGDEWSYGMGGYFSPYHNPKLKDGPKGEFLTDRLTDETIKFIKVQSQKDAPFFVDLSFYAVHQRIESKKKYIEKFRKKARRMGLDTIQQFLTYDSPHNPSDWMRKWSSRVVQGNPVYAGLIYSVDENVGRIMNAIKELGISNNTIIVFTSDNGGKSAQGTPHGVTSNLPLRYGKGWIYEGGIRVPLIIKWPEVTKPGSICQFPVINTNFYPTFLEMADLSPEPEQAKDGVSMVPLLKGGKSIAHPYLSWPYPHYHYGGQSPSSAIRKGDWKLIQFYRDNHIELYNLRIDLGERHNLAEKYPKKTAEMLNKLNQWRKRTQAEIPKINPYYNPGYLKILIDKDPSTYDQFEKEYKTLFPEYIENQEKLKRIHEKFKRYYDPKRR